MTEVEYVDLTSHLNFFFGKNEGSTSESSLTQIRREIEKYIRHTRWADLSVNMGALIEGIYAYGYMILRDDETGDLICNVPLEKVVKLILINSPHVEHRSCDFIKEDDFIKASWQAVKDLVEGDRVREVDLYADEGGMYTSFVHSGTEFKVQFVQDAILITKLSEVGPEPCKKH